MKKLVPYFVAALFGAVATGTFVGAQTNKAPFNIVLKAKGSIELQCHSGCYWKKLGWTCNEDDLSQSCEVAFGESGMTRPKEN